MIPAIVIIVLSILFAYIVHQFGLTMEQKLLYSVLAGILIGVVAAMAEALL